MRRVYKNLCPATISASIMAANMWKNSLKNVESDNNNFFLRNLIRFFLQRNGTYFLNKLRIILLLRKRLTFSNQEADRYFLYHGAVLEFQFQCRKTGTVK